MNLFRLVKPTLFAGASAMTLLMSLDSAKAQAPSNSTGGIISAHVTR